LEDRSEDDDPLPSPTFCRVVELPSMDERGGKTVAPGRSSRSVDGDEIELQKRWREGGV